MLGSLTQRMELDRLLNGLSKSILKTVKNLIPKQDHYTHTMTQIQAKRKLEAILDNLVALLLL